MNIYLSRMSPKTDIMATLLQKRAHETYHYTDANMLSCVHFNVEVSRNQKATVRFLFTTLHGRLAHIVTLMYNQHYAVF